MATVVLADCTGVSHSDEVDVRSAQRFVNSSLAPVHLFRRRLKSVAGVLEAVGSLRLGGEALLRFWDAVCRHGPCGPICSLHPSKSQSSLISVFFLSGL